MISFTFERWNTMSEQHYWHELSDEEVRDLAKTGNKEDKQLESSLDIIRR